MGDNASFTFILKYFKEADCHSREIRVAICELVEMSADGGGGRRGRNAILKRQSLDFIVKRFICTHFCIFVILLFRHCCKTTKKAIQYQVTLRENTIYST